VRSGISTAPAAGILWFSFGYSSRSILYDESGLAIRDAEKWLGWECCRALLPA
jgi:hypothetical protein